MKYMLAGIAISIAGAGISLWIQVRRRHAHRWIAGYLRTISRRRDPRAGKPVHVLLCIADHYEPHHGPVDDARARQRVAAWEREYPKRFGAFHDADGRPPQHTFFYPLEQYHADEMTSLAGLCRQGFGEVEIHLHHDHESPEHLRRRLSDYRDLLGSRHGLLSRDKRTGRLMYGFVHGNWALDNSRPDGKWCGVNNELDILRQTGCYADFTLPSAPSSAQTRRINSIYYASEDGLPNSHDRGGVAVGHGVRPDDSLLLVQGPLLLDWKHRARGFLPRVENGCLQANQPPTRHRLNLWLRARIQVPSQPSWFFVKLYTHGAPEANAASLLGEPMERFHRELAERSAEDGDFHFHYVTAREMYNLVRAAEDGWSGSVNDARDYEILRNDSASQ